MKRLLIYTIFFLSVLITSIYASPSKEHADYWLHVYGVLTEEENPFVERVQSVFSNVLEAADKRGNRFPKLLIIKGDGDPWSLALKDGTIIITQKAIDHCYNYSTQECGDSRIAFIIGHELAHLAKDDFWHADIFSIVKQFGKNEKAVQQIQDLLKKTTNINNSKHAREVIRTKELEADTYGVLYASLAGYNPQLLFTDQKKLFFSLWTDQVTKQVIFDSLHVNSDQRETFLQSNIQSILNQIPLFDFGVRLYQTGKFKDALDFMMEFRKSFPCREVFNNIGLIHFQLAIESLAAINPEEAYRFKLSTMLDTETRAHQYRVTRSLQKEYDIQMENAYKYFQAACEKDSLYIPSRVNLSSIYLMKKKYQNKRQTKYSKAIAVLEDVFQIEPDNRFALNNLAIAKFLQGALNQTDMFKRETDVFKKMIQTHPEFSAPYYNLARIQTDDRKRNAVLIWKQFLSIENHGAYANIARKMIENVSGQKQPSPGKENYLCKWLPKSPVQLGPVAPKTHALLAKYPKHILDIGGVEGEYILHDKFTVLVIEDVVSLVETPVHIDIKNIRDFGSPLKMFQGHPKTKTFVFGNVVIDIEAGKMKTAVYYQTVDNRY